jgi:hypothetical protein
MESGVKRGDLLKIEIYFCHKNPNHLFRQTNKFHVNSPITAEKLLEIRFFSTFVGDPIQAKQPRGDPKPTLIP